MITSISSIPQKKRELQNFLMDSTRWNNFSFRDDDIIIAAYSKSGTTLLQQIVGQLIFDANEKLFAQTVSPWLDFQLTPEAIKQAITQKHRRFLKTHLPIDALVFSSRAKYIYIGRDARDVIWSLHHFLMSFTQFAFERFNEVAEQTKNRMPPIASDVREFYLNWLAHDIYSDNSFWNNVKGWWEARTQPNVLLVHYANLIADLATEFRRIADFLEIPINEKKLSRMLNYCSLNHMKALAAEQPFLKQMFRDEGRSFINKGTNGRWQNILSNEEINACDEIAKAKLSAECVEWLRTGKMAEFSQPAYP